jgi:hypothetical protein
MSLARSGQSKRCRASTGLTSNHGGEPMVEATGSLSHGPTRYWVDVDPNDCVGNPADMMTSNDPTRQTRTRTNATRRECDPSPNATPRPSASDDRLGSAAQREGDCEAQAEGRRQARLTDGRVRDRTACGGALACQCGRTPRRGRSQRGCAPVKNNDQPKAR